MSHSVDRLFTPLFQTLRLRDMHAAAQHAAVQERHYLVARQLTVHRCDGLMPRRVACDTRH
jgi:hypothetical protein